MPFLPLDFPFDLGEDTVAVASESGSVRVPQFDLPFRFDTHGQAVVVEQDSVDDIANCVEAVLRTRVKDRLAHPQFGTMNVLFLQQPIPIDALTAQIKQWEPRVDLLIEQAPDLFDETLLKLNISVSKGE